MRSSRSWTALTPPGAHGEAAGQRAEATPDVTGRVGRVRLRAGRDDCRDLPSNTLRPVSGLPVRQHVPGDAGTARRLQPDLAGRLPEHPGVRLLPPRRAAGLRARPRFGFDCQRGGGTDPGSPSRTTGSALVGIPAEGCSGHDRDHGPDPGDVGGPGRAQRPGEVRPPRGQPCRGLCADGDLHPGTVPCCPGDRGCYRPTWVRPLGRGRVPVSYTHLTLPTIYSV